MRTRIFGLLLCALLASPLGVLAQQQEDGDGKKPLFELRKSKEKKKKKDDSMYLAGAVPEVGGMVCFSQSFSSTMNKEEMLKALQAWAEGYFVPQEATLTKKKTAPAIVSLVSADGKMTVQGDEYLVFKDNALVQDQARIYYTLSVVCSDGSCKATMSRIFYDYNDQQTEENFSRIPAEQQITDQYALRKNGTKLVRGTGTKFRVFTIDLKNRLFEDIQAAIR